jgi:hypothetical protein
VSGVLTDKFAHLRNFWRRANHDRPVIGFTGGYFPKESIRMIRRTGAAIQPDDILVSEFLADCDAQYNAWHQCTGDLIWSAAPVWGFRWMSAIFGQPLHIGEETIWDEPILKGYDQLDQLRFDPNNKWLQALTELTRKLVEHAAGRYCLGVTLLTGPLASLVGLRGAIDFGYDVCDQPDRVEAALGIVTDTWIQVTQCQFGLLPAYHGGYGQPARLLWATGPLVEFDEDSSFLFSPKRHRQLVLPAHRQLLSQLTCSYLHLHSTQLHTLENLMELDELAGLEFTPDVGSPVVNLIPAIRRALTRKPVIVHGYLSVEDINAIIESVPPEGLCIIGRADSPEEAAQLQGAVMGRRGWISSSRSKE